MVRMAAGRLTRFGNGGAAAAPAWGTVASTMKGRRQRPAADDVRGLMAELGSLVDDLGLETSAPPRQPAPEPAAAPAEPPAPEPPPDELSAVPMWEPADEPAPALWGAVSQSDASARPWSPVAAMAVIEPASPPGGHRFTAAPAAPPRERRPHAFTILTAVAVVVAAAVFAFSRLDLGHTSGPPRPLTTVDFSVTGMHTVQASAASEVAHAPLQRRFLTTVPAIFLDITYANVHPSDTLRIVIQLQPDQVDLPPTTVSDETHSHLDPGGEIALTVEAPKGGFTPGTYTVRALHDTHLEQVWTFEVDAPGA